MLQNDFHSRHLQTLWHLPLRAGRPQSSPSLQMTLARSWKREKVSPVMCGFPSAANSDDSWWSRLAPGSLSRRPTILEAASHMRLRGRVGSSHPLRPPAGLPGFLAHPHLSGCLPPSRSSIHSSVCPSIYPIHPLRARPGLLLGVQAWEPRFWAAELGRVDPRP